MIGLALGRELTDLLDNGLAECLTHGARDSLVGRGQAVEREDVYGRGRSQFVGCLRQMRGGEAEGGGGGGSGGKAQGRAGGKSRRDKEGEGPGRARRGESRARLGKVVHKVRFR